MIQFRKILAAVGEFPQDDAILARAAEIAKAHQANLTIVHVIDFQDGFELSTSEQVAFQQLLERAAREKIKVAFARVVADFSNPDIYVESGSPSSRLIELCNELGPDLIVMRAHQRKSILMKLVGSTTDRMIRTSPAPVLVIKRPANQPYQRVLFASDGLEESAAALSFLAELLPSASLQLVQAVNILPQLEQALVSTGLGQSAIDAHRATLIGSAKDNLRTLAAMLPGRAVIPKTRVVVGAPATVLLNASRSPKVDLIAAGPGRAGLVKRALIGSVTQRLVRDAACDVLIWRPREGKSKESGQKQGTSD